jgi:crossover junction endodeoxyribonuclease RuvC
MIIAGVDPALTVSGYGVIRANRASLELIEAGIIKTTAKEATPLRLNKIYQGVLKLIGDRKDIFALQASGNRLYFRPSQGGDLPGGLYSGSAFF